MKKCAIIIGVNNVARMPPLSAAVDGAHQFKKWADSQNFDTFLITDEHTAVTRSLIFQCIKDLVRKNSYSQMVIYFSGHGIWKSVNDEKWLLTNVAEDSMEAVNVQASASMAGSSGIPYIVFISDACRTGTIDPIVSQVTGSSIFPPGQNFSKHSLDMLFSTKALDPSYELKARSEVATSYGIYTKHLLKGLNGGIGKIITTINLDGVNTSVVQAYELQEYLETAVQEEIEAIDIALVQQPQGTITSRPPNFLSIIYNYHQNDADNPPGDGQKDEAYKNSIDDDTSRMYDSLRREPSERIWTFDDNGLEFVVDSLHLNKDIGKSVFEYLKWKQIDSAYWDFRDYEQKRGFVVLGDDDSTENLARINSSNTKITEIKGSDFAKFRHFSVSTKDFLLRISEQNFMPITILPGFLCFVTFFNGKVSNVNYQPTRQNPKFHEFRNRSLEVEIRRAIVHAETKNGSLRMDGRDSEFVRYANYLRNDKAFDPTLGVYAAYGYAQAGIWREVASVYDYMRREPEQVLFDVRMLAALSPYTYITEEPIPLSGTGPILTQGWSYMSIKREIFPEHLMDLAKHLVPGLWTAFNEKGAEIFENHFSK
jgi:hypothetical protein